MWCAVFLQCSEIDGDCFEIFHSQFGNPRIWPHLTPSADQRPTCFPIEQCSKPNVHFIILIYLFRKTFRGTFATIIFVFAIVSGHHHLSHDFRGESGLSICLGFNIKPLGSKSSKFEAVDSWKK